MTEAKSTTKIQLCFGGQFHDGDRDYTDGANNGDGDQTMSETRLNSTAYKLDGTPPCSSRRSYKTSLSAFFHSTSSVAISCIIAAVSGDRFTSTLQMDHRNL
ncbi:hypothetical protein RND81_10G229400 [Saponaria officinalis]|uniref:Uncharacterized protein n=1 Tax=Saponaria officinalis TaxID=3572 RepID=A0AAW1I5W3_SAPOF